MEKYAKSDVHDGYNLMKIGLHNICYALKHKKEVETIELPIKINLLAFTGVINELFPDMEITVKDSTITLKDKDDCTINVLVREDGFIFHRE